MTVHVLCLTERAEESGARRRPTDIGPDHDGAATDATDVERQVWRGARRRPPRCLHSRRRSVLSSG